MTNQRTIRALCECGRVYVFLRGENIGQRFLRMAEEEGFRFGDGAKPSSRHYSEIMALHSDGTIGFVGATGRIAFGSGAEFVGGGKLIRVDFEKYISGAESYLFKNEAPAP